MAKVCVVCLDVCQPLTTRRPSFSLGLPWFLCSMATVIDIWDDSSAGSPRTKSACIVCFLMLSICPHYGTLGFKGQNLTQTSLKCVIVMGHGYFREPQARKAGLLRNESGDGGVFGSRSSHPLRIYMASLICRLLLEIWSLSPVSLPRPLD